VVGSMGGKVPKPDCKSTFWLCPDGKGTSALFQGEKVT
jgi:hypothetical protein